MEWLSVGEAAQRFNKSESAIKRLIYKLQKEVPALVKKEQGKLFISASAFDHDRTTERPAANDRTNGERTTERLTERVKENDYIKIIDILEKELTAKNEQISLLQIDADQKNKLLMHLQTQLQLQPAPNDRTTSERTNERLTERPNDQQQKVLALFFAFGVVILTLLILIFVSL